MNRYIFSHLPIAFIYGLLIALVRGNWLPFELSEIGRWVLFAVGAVIGVLILFLDRVVYTYSYPEEQLSQQFAWFAKNKKGMSGLVLLDARRDEQNKLTFRSALFMAVWVPLALFSVTSTSSLFGKGVVMGLMFHILMDAWRMQKSNPARLNERIFWQIARPVRREEQVVFLTVVTAVFVWFSFWVA